MREFIKTHKEITNSFSIVISGKEPTRNQVESLWYEILDCLSCAQMQKEAQEKSEVSGNHLSVQTEIRSNIRKLEEIIASYDSMLDTLEPYCEKYEI